MLSSCIKDYLADCYGLASRTRDLYNWHLQRFLGAVGDQPVDQLDPSVLRVYLSGLRRLDGEPHKPSFLDQVYRTLHTFFEWCAREAILPQNPMRRVRKPRVPKRKSPRLTQEEIERLLLAVSRTEQSERNLALVALMVDSGLRRGEVLGLRLGDIDLDSRTVRVLGKDKKEREVPISHWTCSLLTSYVSERSDSESDALFLTGRSMNTPLTISGLGSLMRRLKVKADIPNLSCHLLRHTFANWFIAHGGGLRKLQEILGHSDSRITAERYTNPELPELQDALDRCSPFSKVLVLEVPREEERALVSEPDRP